MSSGGGAILRPTSALSTELRRTFDCRRESNPRPGNCTTNALREIDRHRASLGQQLRQAALEAQTQDAAFEVVEAEPAAAQENAA